jgi:hypothetical protein
VLQVQSSDFSNFDSEETLAALRSAGLGNSLQARILAGSGFMRIFDIALFANGVNQELVNAFYDQMIKTTVTVQQRCVFYPDPVPTVVPVQTTDEATPTSSEVSQPTEDAIVAVDAPEVTLGSFENDSGSAPEVISSVQQPDPSIEDSTSAPDQTSGSAVDAPASPIEPTSSDSEAEKPQESKKPTDSPNMTPVAVAVPVAAVGAAAALFMFYRKRTQVAKTAVIPEDSFENSLSNNPLYSQLGTARDNPLFQSVASISEKSTGDFAV